MRPLRFSVLPLRWKMTLTALAPMAFILLLVTIAAFWLINAWVVGQTQQRVRNDLNAAHEVLAHEEDRVADLVRFTAHSAGLLSVLSRGDLDDALEELQLIRRREGLDLLTLTDPSGRVLLRAANPSAAGDAPPFPFLDEVLNGGDFSGPVLLSADELRREGDAVAQAAAIALQASPGKGGTESRGLVLLGASAVHDASGRLLGALYGGILLNDDQRLVDRIKAIVYGSERFEGAEVGSATIFLEEVRVATTIRLKDGRRATGTRVSPEVAAAVLGEGETWLARARVVDEWYLTAYEPIRGPDGQPIGALYVGLLEEPFNALKRRASLVLFGLLLLGTAVGCLVAHQLARRVAKPILELEGSVQRIARGERSVVLPVEGPDEVGRLTHAFNDMSVALHEQEEALGRLNRELEGKVVERTAALEEKSLELIRTQEELLRAEKLAAIGELASGVAHEINNPAAIIRGNVELLLAQLPADHPSREEGEEILRQTERIALITRNMLAFARGQSLGFGPVALNPLLRQILTQLGHLSPLDGIRVVTDLDPDLPPVAGDGERLRQVFINILLNALQAMNGLGTLTVRSIRGEEMVEVEIADTGPGIPAELLKKIFNPFFTTKGSGTGLGLSVSYGIVQGHGGLIEVDSEPGAGARFRICLPQQSDEA